MCLSVDVKRITIEKTPNMDFVMPPSDNLHTDANELRYLGEPVTSESGEFSNWHSHDFGQLISATNGAMYVGTPNCVLLLSPAMAIWIPPNVNHWIRSSLNNEMLYVDVNREEAKALRCECYILAMTPLLNALMQTTLPEHVAAKTTQHIDRLYDLLRVELQTALEVPLSVVMPSDKRIHEMAKAAFTDPNVAASIEDWLASVAASRKTIERLFVAETGMTPAQWIRHVRILHAISKLATGEKVSSVALDMGYESLSAFSYMFRKTLGVSPKTFQQKSRA